MLGVYRRWDLGRVKWQTPTFLTFHYSSTSLDVLIYANWLCKLCFYSDGFYVISKLCIWLDNGSKQTKWKEWILQECSSATFWKSQLYWLELSCSYFAPKVSICTWVVFEVSAISYKCIQTLIYPESQHYLHGTSILVRCH